jgi:8-oxo-dGTP diphosphatase
LLVVAAAIFRDGKVLIAQRPPGKHMAGRWEFPGGKVDPGESEAQALVRELKEELGIVAVASHPFMTASHTYENHEVELSMWIVDDFHGEPEALDGQEALKWVRPAELLVEDIVEADLPFVDALQSL